MTYSLIVSGTRFSGKSALVLGLFWKFKEAGFSVGYFKPVGHAERRIVGKRVDPDVRLMKELMGLEEDLETICPVVLGKRYLDDLDEKGDKTRDKIIESFTKIKKSYDVILIESAPSPELLTGHQLDAGSLSKMLRAKIVFSIRGTDDSIADMAILYDEFIRIRGGQILGIVLNFIEKQQMERVRGVISPALEKRGLEVIGIVPDQRELTLPTVHDVAQELNAEILSGEERLDNLVDDFLVGAMTPESALSWLRRSMGRALITGGDRTDLILVALETRPSAIILTGNIYPSVRVLNVAKDKGIPILLVSDDTYSTLSKLEFLEGRIIASPSSEKKIKLTRDIINEYVEWEKILDDFQQSSHTTG
jgi:BioD-like phosphotransacetylase family protein